MKNVVIKTRNLCKSYGSGNNVQNILKNIDLEINQGDFTIIMGSSGSGKSTLLNVISSMDRATSGEVELLGKNLTKMNDKDINQIRRKEISFIFQNINLLPDLTSFENIAYPAYLNVTKEIANFKAEKLLEKIGLESQKNKYPSEMSGGQRQRIAIARALATDPKIVFADEPTGALNSASGAQVLDIFSELNKNGQSIVMVTHDIKACVRGNRLIFISDGRVDGDLNLGLYNSSEQKNREDMVFNFLKTHKW